MKCDRNKMWMADLLSMFSLPCFQWYYTTLQRNTPTKTGSPWRPSSGQWQRQHSHPFWAEQAERQLGDSTSEEVLRETICRQQSVRFDGKMERLKNIHEATHVHGFVPTWMKWVIEKRRGRQLFSCGALSCDYYRKLTCSIHVEHETFWVYFTALRLVFKKKKLNPLRSIILGKISDQASKLEKCSTACEKTKRESTCGYNNARAFIVQSHMQARKCFKAETGDGGHTTAKQQFQTGLGWLTHQCFVSWNVWPFIPMHGLWGFHQFGHWVLMSILFMLYGRYRIFILFQGAHKSQPF